MNDTNHWLILTDRDDQGSKAMEEKGDLKPEP